MTRVHTMPSKPQKKRNRHATHCVMWSGRCRYVQDSALKSTSMAQPVTCSRPPPIAAEMRKICHVFAPCRRIWKHNTVRRTAPVPYSGLKGPHTRPTRFSVRPAVTSIQISSSKSPAMQPTKKMMMTWYQLRFMLSRYSSTASLVACQRANTRARPRFRLARAISRSSASSDSTIARTAGSRLSSSMLWPRCSHSEK